MMKRLLIATCATIMTAGAASAADLPSRAPPPVYAPVPAFTWTGFYAGFNVGYVWSDESVRTTPFFDPTTNIIGAAAQLGITALGLDNPKFSQDGVTVGGQAGYNYQFTPGSGFVVGIEADAQYTDLNRRRNSAFSLDIGNVLPLPLGIAAVTLDNTSQKSLSFIGTVRGRVGYAFDRFLVYGTGGFAYGESEFQTLTNVGANVLGVPIGPLLTVAGGRSGIQTGYAYGGGIEYAMPQDSFLNFFKASAVTFKVEYLHYDLGTRNVLANLTSPVPVLNALIGTVPFHVSRVREAGDLVRVGVNYKF